jgi:WD40 repeat protein
MKETGMKIRWRSFATVLLVLGPSASVLGELQKGDQPALPTVWQVPTSLSVIATAAKSTRLVAVGNDGIARVWDAATGREIRTITDKAGASTRAALSADGRTIALARLDGTVTVWDVDTGRRLHELKTTPNEMVLALSFALDGQTLVAVSVQPSPSDFWITFSVSSAPVVSVDTEIVLPKAKGDVKEAREVQDLKLELKDVKVETKELKLPIKEVVINEVFFEPVQVDLIPYLAFSPDGTLLTYSAGIQSVVPKDATLRVRRWDVRTGKSTGERTIWDQRRLAGPIVSGGGAAPVLSADGNLLAISNGAEAVSVWDLTSGRPLASLEIAGPVTAIALSPDGHNLAVGSTSQLAVHEVITGKQRYRLNGSAACLAFAADGRTLAAGLADGVVQVWDSVGSRDLGRRAGHKSGITSVALVAGGKTLVAAASPPPNQAVHLWNLSTVTPVKNGLNIVTTGNGNMMFRPTVKQPPEPATPVMAWDVSAMRGASPSARSTTDSLWDDLAAADAARAYQALCGLSAHPDTLALLGDRLQPVMAADPKRIAQLIADLEDHRFAVRQRAADELERLGETAEVQLQQALARRPSLDLRRRVELLLGRLANPWLPSTEELRAIRGVEVLERIGNSAARRLLERLAEGASQTPLTQHAQRALQRLGNVTP